MAVKKQSECYEYGWIPLPGFILSVFQVGLLAVLLGYADTGGAEESVCQRVIGSQCDASQEAMLDALLKDMNVYGYAERKLENDGKVPAFEQLPKDRYGLVNWTKAQADGIISPRCSIDGSPCPKEQNEEDFFENIILLQTQVHFMPDVLFPHGVHSNLIGCESCHPKPFKKENGANPIRMSEIFEGKWCGKCHGKVAFPVQQFNNCRRCHVMRKTAFGKPYSPSK